MIFVTATDTDVGKTYFSNSLIKFPSGIAKTTFSNFLPKDLHALNMILAIISTLLLQTPQPQAPNINISDL